MMPATVDPTATTALKFRLSQLMRGTQISSPERMVDSDNSISRRRLATTTSPPRRSMTLPSSAHCERPLAMATASATLIVGSSG